MPFDALMLALAMLNVNQAPLVLPRNFGSKQIWLEPHILRYTLNTGGGLSGRL